MWKKLMRCLPFLYLFILVVPLFQTFPSTFSIMNETKPKPNKTIKFQSSTRCFKCKSFYRQYNISIIIHYSDTCLIIFVKVQNRQTILEDNKICNIWHDRWLGNYCLSVLSKTNEKSNYMPSCLWKVNMNHISIFQHSFHFINCS